MRRFLVVLSVAMLAASAVAQVKQVKQERRPALTEENFAKAQQPPKQPSYEFFSILDGLPVLLDLHHDTEVETGRPVDVCQFVIELQVLNSDGNLEAKACRFSTSIPPSRKIRIPRRIRTMRMTAAHGTSS